MTNTSKNIHCCSYKNWTFFIYLFLSFSNFNVQATVGIQKIKLLLLTLFLIFVYPASFMTANFTSRYEMYQLITICLRCSILIFNLLLNSVAVLQNYVLQQLY